MTNNPGNINNINATNNTDINGVNFETLLQNCGTRYY